MPNLFVVADQRSAAALAAALLPSRVAAADRYAAVAALRAANPDLDLDRLRPGTVIVVPPSLDRLRRGAADDPAGDAADALLVEVRAGLAVLAAGQEAAAEQAKAEREATFELLDSPVVSRLAKDPLLAANIESVRKALAEEESGTEQEQAALRGAMASWQADLKALRGLL